jgi:DNA-binding Xre family transcriptional regulator
MNAIINVSLILQRIREKNLTGLSDAAAHCGTSIKNFHKLARGELPRLDALQRICRGLEITEQQLILGMSKGKAARDPAGVVDLGRSAHRLKKAL